MAKDPAFLFYSNDFDSKTKFLSHEQVGKLVRLIIAQHQHGRLTLKQVEFVCSGKVDPEVLAKLQIDEDGLYYNDRLEHELERRKKFSKSRRNNPLGKNQWSKGVVTRPKDDQHYDQVCRGHMETETETENISNESVGNKFKPPTLQEVEAYCIDRNNTVNPNRFIDFYSSKGWMVGKNKMKDWKAAVRGWEQSNVKVTPVEVNAGTIQSAQRLEEVWRIEDEQSGV